MAQTVVDYPLILWDSNLGGFTMDNLILTGWGWKDYACAAALALRHWKNADLLGISTRRLPEFLADVKGYKNIVILGVGLSGDSETLAKALARLKAQGSQITWISCIPLPEFLPEGVRSNMEVFVGGDGITDAVSLCYNIPYDDLRPLLNEASPSREVQATHLLLEAAMYAYRNYQDERSFHNAVRHIAKGDPEALWTDSEHQLVEHYKRYGNRELVGKSETMQELQAQINKIAPHDHARVLIFGESGTGKETVALQIHNKSPRRWEPFITFNCASVTPNLLESRFFGHEKGAFTGANEMRRGLFELADGGTLFLDEIGELPLEAQGILLRVLEEGRFNRMGGTKEIEVNVRLITATNRDLAAMVRDGKFRADLFHRLNVVQIRVAPLREHKSDVEQIANGYWLKQHKHRLAPEQIAALQTYDYPGNVRELHNLLERASVLDETDFNRLLAEHRMMTENLIPQSEPEVPDELDAAIRLHVKRVYAKYDSNLSKTAAALKAARNTVRKYLED